MSLDAETELLRPAPAPPENAQWYLGWCWFFCGHQYTQVLWIGVISTASGHAPLFACASCLDVLHDSVLDYADATAHLPSDEYGQSVDLYVSAEEGRPSELRFRRGRHRKPRTPLGQRFLRAISAPDDRASLDRPPPAARRPEPAFPRAEPRRKAAFHARQHPQTRAADELTPVT